MPCWLVSLLLPPCEPPEQDQQRDRDDETHGQVPVLLVAHHLQWQSQNEISTRGTRAANLMASCTLAEKTV